MQDERLIHDKHSHAGQHMLNDEENNQTYSNNGQVNTENDNDVTPDFDEIKKSKHIDHPEYEQLADRNGVYRISLDENKDGQDSAGQEAKTGTFRNQYNRKSTDGDFNQESENQGVEDFAIDPQKLGIELPEFTEESNEEDQENINQMNLQDAKKSSKLNSAQNSQAFGKSDIQNSSLKDGSTKSKTTAFMTPVANQKSEEVNLQNSDRKVNKANQNDINTHIDYFKEDPKSYPKKQGTKEFGSEIASLADDDFYIETNQSRNHNAANQNDFEFEKNGTTKSIKLKSVDCNESPITATNTSQQEASNEKNRPSRKTMKSNSSASPQKVQFENISDHTPNKSPGSDENPLGKSASNNKKTKSVVFDTESVKEKLNISSTSEELKNDDIKKQRSNSRGMTLSPDQSVEIDPNFRYTPEYFQKLEKNRSNVIITHRNKVTQQHLLDFGKDEENIINPEDGRPSKVINQQFMKELASIEKQKQWRIEMEKFILLFNQKAQKGIDYLVKSGYIENDPKMIARILLETEGLNKEIIGQLLGSEKEENQKILKAYCELRDFSKLSMDEAMRSFLSRFKLPGEAQQIERIVTAFSEVFYQDNKDQFPSDETTFILAYSILILHTNLHSSMVALKDKMPREKFVENTFKDLKKVLSKEYIGQIYDNILKSKFETKVDSMEGVYRGLNSGESFKNMIAIAKELMKGAVFIKYGRRGQPHPRKVWISDKEDYIYYLDPKKDKKPKQIPMAEVTDILSGYNSTKVLKKNNVPPEFDLFVLSIITTKRTLDLRASDAQVKLKWERYFRTYLLQRKNIKVDKTITKRNYEKEKISEIWKVDILPNWESHWDYQTQKPKALEMNISTKVKTKGKTGQENEEKESWSFWNMLCSFGKQKRPKSGDIDSKKSLIIHERDDTEAELRTMCKNKSLLLVTLWKKGIPDWLKKTLWPISIANQLEITQALYEHLKTQANNLTQSMMMKEESETYLSYKRMQDDMQETFPFASEFEIEDKKDIVVNILQAFMHYRPDLSYVKGMCHLATVMVMYCSEYQAFTCFVNLTHSHHFLSFFRGTMREIEWRIRFFNDGFKKELPSLYDHFKGLALGTEMFLLDWFLSLFALSINDIEIVSRIWDNFLLEGEVFAYKATLGILKYYEHELKLLTFDGAIKFLKKLPKDIDEDILFKTIENTSITWKEFQSAVEKQRIADTNTEIHQALLY